MELGAKSLGFLCKLSVQITYACMCVCVSVALTLVRLKYFKMFIGKVTKVFVGSVISDTKHYRGYNHRPTDVENRCRSSVYLNQFRSDRNEINLLIKIFLCMTAVMSNHRRLCSMASICKDFYTHFWIN